jgi:hypothetical protein
MPKTAGKSKTGDRLATCPFKLPCQRVQEHQMKKVRLPDGKPAGRISCPQCGNESNFIEEATDCILTTFYVQNDDGSFTPEDNETEVLGEVKLLCGQCNHDLSQYHLHFQEMIF